MGVAAKAEEVLSGLALLRNSTVYIQYLLFNKQVRASSQYDNFLGTLEGF